MLHNRAGGAGVARARGWARLGAVAFHRRKSRSRRAGLGKCRGHAEAQGGACRFWARP